MYLPFSVNGTVIFNKFLIFIFVVGWVNSDSQATNSSACCIRITQVMGQSWSDSSFSIVSISFIVVMKMIRLVVAMSWKQALY